MTGHDSTALLICCDEYAWNNWARLVGQIQGLSVVRSSFNDFNGATRSAGGAGAILAAIGSTEIEFIAHLRPDRLKGQVKTDWCLQVLSQGDLYTTYAQLLNELLATFAEHNCPAYRCTRKRGQLVLTPLRLGVESE